MIVGAGLAGLIAAHAFPRHEIFEVSPEPAQAHQALLRFRSTAVAETSRNKSPATCAKISASNTGKRHTAEAKAKMSETRKGQPGKRHSPETKAKLSTLAKARFAKIKQEQQS